MTLLTRCFVRSGFGCLLLALGLAVVVALLPPSSPWTTALWPAEVHLLTVGWLTQLIFGIAWWLFPRAPRAGVTYRSAAAWLSFGMLQVGLGLRVVFEPLRSGGHYAATIGALLVVAAVLQFLTVAAFTVAIWPRIRER